MFKNKYEADNSRFGEVLTQVLSAHGIGVRQFLAEAKVGKTRLYDINRGQGDYSLSTYVRIVNAMGEFIFNEAELLRAHRPASCYCQVINSSIPPMGYA